MTEHVLQGGTIEADITLASRAGVSGLSVLRSEVARVGASTVRQRLDDVGLSASSVMAIGDIAGTREPDPERTAWALEAANQIGAQHLLVYTGPLGTSSVAHADERCRHWFAEVRPRSRDAGIALMLEPMFPMMRQVTYVHTLRHALRIVEPFDDVKVVVDTAHLWWEPDLVELVRDNLERIGSIQLSNLSSDAFASRTFRRARLGEGVVPLRDLVRAFDRAGFRGWYEHEVIADDVGDKAAFVRQEREWFEGVFD